MQPLSNRTHSIGRSIGGWVGTGLIGSTLLVISPAAAANTLSAWQFDPVSRQFTVTLPRGVTPRFVVAAEPARIILEIPQTRLGPVETEATYDGPVSAVRLAQLEGDTLQVVLQLAPGVVLDSNHAQLTSMAAGDQTRWVLTPLVTATGTVAVNPIDNNQGLNPAGALPQLPTVDTDPTALDDLSTEALASSPGLPSLPLDLDQTDDSLNAAPAADTSAPMEATPSTPEMVVELPVIPAAEPGLGFPEAGQGRLSTTAANLMLPSDLDGLENLPETLPIDPFAIGMAETESVTVPGLDELDAQVGPLAGVPGLPQPEAADDEDAPTAETDLTASTELGEMDNPASPPAIAVAPPQTPAAAASPDPQLQATQPATAVNGANDAAAEVPQSVAVVPGPEAAIATSPPNLSAPASSGPDNSALASAPSLGAVEEESPAAQSESVELTVVPAEPAASSAPQPEAPSSDDRPETATAQPQIASQNRATPQEPAGVITVAPPAQEPAPAASAVAGVSPSQDVLMVPELPATNSTETVVPPSNAPVGELVVAASGPINFGQPLPGTGENAINETMDMDAVPAETQPVPPDILIAAGTVLQLRYPGNQPLVLEPGTNLNEVMMLESEIRDPITQGVLAPRGSQLIGQFQPNGTNQQWVSEMIIVPAGQRVPLASTSETLIGSPQVDNGRLAAGTGAGALALALLTGFSGIGLIGGAIVGATTMVGTSPQQVVIEPNQIIAVQVTENVPRSMPIASGPDLSREWGVE